MEACGRRLICGREVDEARRMATMKQEGKKSNSATGAPFPKGVSQPAIRALASAGYTHVDQLAGVSEKHLRMLHGMGPKTLRIIGEALRGQGKSFKP
jgi:hypothetical protein